MRYFFTLLLFLILSGVASAQLTSVPPFPGSPTTNQEVVGPDGQIYRWDGNKWVHGGANLAGPWAPETNPPNGANNYAPINNPTFTGTVTLPNAAIADAMLLAAYSGIGSCAAGSAVTALTRNAAPTCSPFLPVNNPAFTGLMTGPRILLTDANASVLFNSSTVPRAAMRDTTASADGGMTGGVNLQIAAGGHFNGTNWIADTTIPALLEIMRGGISISIGNAVTGQGNVTVGNTFTPRKTAAFTRSNWPANGGGEFLWEYYQNGIAPLVQTENYSLNTSRAAASGFDAIINGPTITAGLQHNLWLLNRNLGFANSQLGQSTRETDRPDTAFIGTDDANGLIIATWHPAEIWLQAGEAPGPGGGMWLASGGGNGGIAIGGDNVWIGYPPAWRTSLNVTNNGIFVEHMQNVSDAGVPTLTGGTLQAGSRDTFGFITMNVRGIMNLTFSRPFTNEAGGPVGISCVLTGYNANPWLVWNTWAQNSWQVEFRCFNLGTMDWCDPPVQVGYHCAGMGG